jgi:hypothetical protein
MKTFVSRSTATWRLSPAAYEKTDRLHKRTQIVLFPVWVVLAFLMFALGVNRSNYAFVPIAAMLAINVGTNIYFSARRRQIIAAYPLPPAPMVRDERSGRWVAADDLRAPIVDRLRTGIRAMLTSTRCVAETSDPFDDVQWQLYEAGVAEGETYWSVPSRNGRWIELALRAPNIRNRLFMYVKGELAPGPVTTFSGSIQPDTQMVILGIAPVLVFFIGGPIAVIVGIGSLFFVSTADHGGMASLTFWGVFASIGSSSFIMKFAWMYETQVRLLRRVFGDRLTLGNRSIADG